MIEVLFPNGVGTFKYGATAASDVLAGSSEAESVESQLMKIVGECALELSTSLDGGLKAACVIMQANLLGFRALSNECRRNHELYR